MRSKYRIRKTRSVLQSRGLRFALLFFLLAAGLSYFFFFSPFWQVKDFEVSGERQVPVSLIRENIEPLLTSHFLFLASRSLLLLDAKKIARTLPEKSFLIDGVLVKKKWPDRLEIQIRERQAVANWCQKQCFVIDQKGVAFAPSDKNQGDFTIHSSSVQEVSLGQSITDPKILEKIRGIKSAVKQDSRVEVMEFTLAENDSRLDAKTSEGWSIYFSLADDVNWQLLRLKLVLEKELPPEKRLNLQYIDLRFSKAYYK